MIYHSLLILPVLSSASPLAGALWLGRKTAVRERPRVDDNPFVSKLRLHHQPVQTKQLWTLRTCVWIGNPKPAEEKGQSPQYARLHRASQMASKFTEGVARGEPSFPFKKGLFLGLLILDFLPHPSVSSSANSSPAVEGEGSASIALASRGNLLEMQNFRPCPSPPESESAL